MGGRFRAWPAKHRIGGRIALPLAFLALGGLLDLVSRPDSLRMFLWLKAIGLSPLASELRPLAAPVLPALPSWLLGSLPQALWFLAGLFGVDAIWGLGRPNALSRRVWLLAVSALAFGWELGQGFGWVPGTFDPFDLAELVLAALLYSVLRGRNRFKLVEQFGRRVSA